MKEKLGLVKLNKKESNEVKAGLNKKHCKIRAAESGACYCTDTDKCPCGLCIVKCTNGDVEAE